MDKISKKSFAKINLTLDVLGKREDGYHLIKMIMQSVSLYDIVTVTKTNEGITLSTNLHYLPINSDNIAYKAAKLFFEYTNITDCGVNIEISKRIPVGAGLAGGSSNAAATLKALNVLFNTHLSKKELCSLGEKLGADVPYCILGGTMLAEGIGEKLSKLPHMPDCTILLVKPAFSVSTPAVYKKFDSYTIFEKPDTDAVIEGLKNEDLEKLVSGMGNVLEAVCLDQHKVLGVIKEEMLELGAMKSQMSGSGPTIFGIFTSYNDAYKAKEVLRKKYKSAYICSPV